MAYVRKIKSGYWQVSIRRKGHPQLSKTFEFEKDAKDWGIIKESEIRRGVFVDLAEASATTIKKALERYEEEVSIKKDGHAQEKVRINSWKEDDLSAKTLASLKSSDLAKWRDKRLKTVSPSTVAKDLAVISNLYTIANKEWGIEVINPCAKVSVKQEDNSRERRLEKGEEAKILKELEPLKFRGQTRSPLMIPVVKLALETCARQSELLGLSWADIDTVKGAIRIRGKDREDGKSRNKNKQKFRDIPMSPAAKSIFEELKVLNKARAVPTIKALPISSQVVKQAWAAALERAEIHGLTFHDLRHEAISRIAGKLQMHELMKITGHSSSRQLARYYHPKIEDLAAKLYGKN
jgi:integrase